MYIYIYMHCIFIPVDLFARLLDVEIQLQAGPKIPPCYGEPSALAVSVNMCTSCGQNRYGPLGFQYRIADNLMTYYLVSYVNMCSSCKQSCSLQVSTPVGLGIHWHRYLLHSCENRCDKLVDLTCAPRSKLAKVGGEWGKVKSQHWVPLCYTQCEALWVAGILVFCRYWKQQLVIQQ